MEGSSESGPGRVNSSFLDRNPTITRTSGGVVASSHDSDHLSVIKSRERRKNLWPHINNYRIQTGPDEARPVESHDVVVSLRHWLDNPERAVDFLECLHIFTQIVDIVNLAHSQGVIVHNVRPSCFLMSEFNRVSFIESGSCSDSGSDDSREYASGASRINSETSCLQSCSGRDDDNNKKTYFPMKQILVLESNWYSAPEEVSGGDVSCASDIYRLGVLLFELFCAFSSPDEKSSTMESLRHRVLPPQLLLKWPKEASFCLWLLHPDPNSRPKIGELLQSEFMNEPRSDIQEREAAIDLREEIEEHDLLLEFLRTLEQKKIEAANILNEAISFISSDIEEATNLQTSLRSKKYGSSLELAKNPGSRKRILDVDNRDEPDDGNQETAFSKSSRLMKNFRKVESAYFSTRRRAVKKPASWPLGRRSNPLERKESSNDNKKQSGWVDTFLDGLCRYLAFSKLRVKADLKQGDLLNSTNLVCSLSFDRDGEFFAAAGVNKKIKVFEYDSIVSEGRDIHYPVVEMGTGSKLSSICWNGYIKSQIASSNFEGVVQVWDVTRSQAYMEMREHERRVWSVDFSMADPTLLASGSDDGSVKLWNINQGASVGTIRTKANVCCVQFSTDSGRTLAFGSADHRIYYYDLRNSKVPLCTLVGHSKTVSYVKFIDSTTLVSASTDNTLKLWDLSMCTSRVLDCPVQSFTGHLNLKNFVGLSVSDGYIATGSETNEVFIYHKAFPMPALSFKFNSTDPFTGDEVDDSAPQFISSVCWRGQSSALLAANSMGNIKLLEMA